MDEILAAAASSDLVVLGPRGVNPLRDFFLGSTAERMARMIECPMLVAKQDPQIPTRMCSCRLTSPTIPRPRYGSRLRWRHRCFAPYHAFHALDEGIRPTPRIQRKANASMAELTSAWQRTHGIWDGAGRDARVIIKERAAANRCT